MMSHFPTSGSETVPPDHSARGQLRPERNSRINGVCLKDTHPLRYLWYIEYIIITTCLYHVTAGHSNIEQCRKNRSLVKYEVNNDDITAFVIVGIS